MEPKPKQYPVGALVRAGEITSREGEPGILPIARSTWQRWVAAGVVPPGRRIGMRTTVWPIEVVLAAGRSEPQA